MTNQRAIRYLALSLSLSLAACAKKSDKPAPVVSSMTQSKAASEVPAATVTAALPSNGNGASSRSEITVSQPAKPAGALVSEVTLNKAAILGRTFNYSSTLQFSSVVSEDISTSMMGLALGEVPAYFNIMDDKLELLTDGRINFESDVDHPSRLIYVFPILRQDEATITIRADGASPISDTFMNGNDNKTPVRYSFLRSMQYAADDELMMLESTVELKDGSVGEFMESFRPREKTVSADAKVIFNDPDLNPLASRYDFLDAGKVFVAKPGKPDVRVQTKVAYHWDVSKLPIKWYVTKNIPDQYVDAVKNGVEGWNRYSRAAGMPDLIKFEGKLPDDVKIGDPRYNTIVWDTVQDAGAAYESQNGDPTTGIQSHSMIYIPLAWVNIGKDYWNKFAPDTQSPGELQAFRINSLLAGRSFMGRALPIHCMNEAEMHLSAESRENPEAFAKGLLRGVVFHEVGHSFGLGHQFKGSLTYDADDASKPFTNSIMDYNDYNEEEAAFAGADTFDGPLLEYDRQIISVLYNNGKDVKDGDAEIPACADDVADSTDNGVDPLCVRYDIGSDPTKEALKALQLFTVAGSKRGSMSAIDAKKVTDALLGLPAADTVKTEGDVMTAVAKSQALVAGTVGIYISSSANSFGYLGSTAVKSLKVFQKGVLPGGYDENEMRDRALQAFTAGTEMIEFPEVTKQALAAAKPAVLQYVQSTAYVAGLPRDGQEKLMSSLSEMMDKTLVTDLQTSILSKLHTRFINAVANTPTAPMGFLKKDGKLVDVELVVMSSLAALAGEKLGTANRPIAERTAALAALKTYKVSENYRAIAERVITALKAEIESSTNALRRQSIRTLLDGFTKETASK